MTRRAAIVAALIAAAVFTAVDVLVQVRYGIDSRTQYAYEIASVVAWTTGGTLACALRPANRTGPLVLGLGLVLAANIAFGDSLDNRSWPVIALSTWGALVTPLQWSVGIHIALAFPTGVLPGPRTTALVRFGYAWAAFGPLVSLLGMQVRPCPSCASPGGLGLFGTKATASALDADQIIFAVLIAVAFVLYCRRFVAATRHERWVLVYPSIGLLVTFAGAVLFLLVRPLRLASLLGTGAAEAVEISAAAAFPIGFLLGLLRDRLDEARVSDLVARIATTPVGELDPAIARALGDPYARLVFETADGDRVDAAGQPVEAGRGARLTPVGTGVFLLHDRGLDAQPELVTGVGSAAALALENARLRAEVLAQLAEVRASRARLVDAGDAARRRLERNLHDGAQQRLVALGLGLRLLRQRIDDADGETLALFHETEGQTREAIRELRDLARGIHPAILTEQGLAAAIEQLANRCPVPVALDVAVPDGLPPSVASTAYFTASEALANVAKHAAASAVTLRLSTDGDRIVLVVADDGVGGALVTSGSGLAGLADRVAAMGGVLTVRSKPGGGTNVRAAIPIDPPGAHVPS